MSASVVMLPTAAPLKVRQPMTREARAACEALPQFPLERVLKQSPYAKRNLETASLMVEAGDTAMLQLAMALFCVLTDEQRARTVGRLIALKALNRPGAASALAWVEYENAPKSRKKDIDAAGLLVAKGVQP